jgi:hypothetical protein
MWRKAATQSSVEGFASQRLRLADRLMHCNCVWDIRQVPNRGAVPVVGLMEMSLRRRRRRIVQGRETIADGLGPFQYPGWRRWCDLQTRWGSCRFGSLVWEGFGLSPNRLCLVPQVLFVGRGLDQGQDGRAVAF